MNWFLASRMNWLDWRRGTFVGQFRFPKAHVGIRTMNRIVLYLLNGNYINAEMVRAFLSSSEYRQRFGPP